MKFTKRIISVLLAAMLALPAAADSEEAEFILTLEQGGSVEDISTEISALGCEILNVYSTAFSGLALSGEAYLMPELRSIPGVARVALSREYEVCAERAVNVGIAPFGGDTLDLPYRGEGMVAAILDSCFDASHPAFTLSDDASGRITEDTVEHLLERSSGTANYYRKNPDESPYYSAKLPFVYDYYENDGDVSGASQHGTHVAGILGANKKGDPEEGFDGVAPECQLLLMKVGDGSNVVSDRAILAAFDDALSLGVDVVNMSFGISAGFDTMMLSSVNYEYLFKTAEALGVEVICAAGNEGNIGEGSNYEASLPLAENPDAGLISEPASLSSTLAVASSEPEFTVGGAMMLTEGGSELYYYDSDSPHALLDTIEVGEYPLVHIGGVGEPSDFEAAGDISGMIATVSRGVITFEAKTKNAAEAGALALIIYDNEEADEPLNMAVGEAAIPSVSVTKASGDALLASSRITLKYDTTLRENERAGGLSSFSSGGATPNLALGIGITAPGSGIRSTLPGGKYGVMSGTSMATPYISGAYLIMKQRYGDDMPLERLMGSATPLVAEGCEISPRMQGSGEVNLERALSCELVLSGEAGGYVALGEIDPAGFAFEVRVRNTSERAITMSLSSTMATDGVISRREGSFISGTQPLTGGVMRLEGGRNLNRYHNGGAPTALTLEAGEERVLSFEAYVSSGNTRRLLEDFVNGFFVEGYIELEYDGIPLSIPYMGFAGDWDALPVIELESGFYPQYALTCIADGYDEISIELAGDGERVYFSPDGNGNGDKLGFRLNPLRNASEYGYMILDSTGEIICINEDLGYLCKATASGDGLDGTTLEWLWDGSYSKNSNYYFPDGDYALVFFVLPRDSSEAYQQATLKVTIDREKPRVEYTEAEGRLTFSAEDRSGIMSMSFYNMAGYEITGEGESFAVDTAELSGVYYLEVCDLALNLTVLRFEF